MKKRHPIFVGLALLAAVGTMLMLWASTLPEYTDPARASELQATSLIGIEDHNAFLGQWYEDMEAIRTDKWPINDLGRGLIAISLYFFIAMSALRYSRLRDFQKLHSPRNRWHFLAMGSAIWLGLIPAFYHYYGENGVRGYYHQHADSLAIPLGGSTAFVLTTLPIAIGIGALLLIPMGRLPTRLWIWCPDKLVRAWGWTFFYGLFAALFTILLVDAVIFGRFIDILLGMIALYLTLSARAATLAPKPI